MRLAYELIEWNVRAEVPFVPTVDREKVCHHARAEVVALALHTADQGTWSATGPRKKRVESRDHGLRGRRCEMLVGDGDAPLAPELADACKCRSYDVFVEKVYAVLRE